MTRRATASVRAWLRTPITDRVVGVVFLLAGAAMLWETRRLEYWDAFGPGARFVPTWVAIGMIVSAVYLLLKNESQAKIPSSVAKEVGIYVTLTIAAVLLFNRIGALLSFWIFITLELKLLEKYGWARAALIATVVVAIFYVIFSVGLRVSLPANPIRP